MTASPPPPALPDGRYVEVPGARLWVADTEGPGEAVVLLHSAVGSVPHWSYQFGPLAAAGYRVIAFDRRTHGRSVQLASDGADPSVSDCAALLDELGVRRAHVVGVAQGGRVAAELALTAPSSVATLALIASSGGVRLPSRVPDAPPLMPPGFTSLPTWFTELGASYRSSDPEGVLRWIGLGNEHPAGLAAPAAGIDAADLATIPAPVLLLGGDADGFTPPPVLRRLAPLFRDARIAILRECGHSPQWERPGEFNSELLAFFRAHA
ncbi:alpha/beta hydrolase [Spirillospora sp. NPDC029432]|uniref:alpha/beta fold hydrolase n=1 Tax=Spirillospora sp. NPDC029432 TaxID=3154599 RepID=UPI003452B5ED